MVLMRPPHFLSVWSGGVEGKEPGVPTEEAERVVQLHARCDAGPGLAAGGGSGAELHTFVQAWRQVFVDAVKAWENPEFGRQNCFPTQTNCFPTKRVYCGILRNSTPRSDSAGLRRFKRTSSGLPPGPNQSLDVA